MPKKSERRAEVNVVDRPTEVGIKLNNILTALVLMVMSWVGYNINQMKEDIGEVRADWRVMAVEQQFLKERLDEHIKDHK